MNIFDNFYFNYPAISTLENFFLFFACTIFLISIPNKSQATKYLTLTTFFGMFVGLGYFLSQGVYAEVPIARVMTLIAVPLHFLFYSQFVIHFPHLENPRLAKALLIVQSIITFLITMYLFYLIYTRPIAFDFDGESFEYDFLDYLKLYGWITFAFILIAFFLAVWKIFILKGKDRYYQLLISLGIFVAIVVPGLANVLGKLGIVTRGAYLVTVSLSTNTGVFILIIAFINRTVDRTTFMAKILSVSFLVFIIVYNFLAYFALKEREVSYLLLKKQDLELSLIKPEVVNDLRYTVSYHLENESLKTTNKGDEVYLNEFHKIDLFKALYLRNFINMPLNQTESHTFWESFFNNNFLEEKSYIIPFHQFLLPKVKEGITNSELPLVIEENAVKLFRIYNNLKQLPAVTFKKQLPKFLEKQTSEFEPFKQAMLLYLQKNIDQDDLLFREGILQFVKPYPMKDQKLFREDKRTKRHFISYIVFDEKNLVLSEVGFEYLFYRNYIHQEAKVFVYLLFFALILIFVGTPLFLARALIMPLQRLLLGLRKVQKGNLDVEVEVGVHDEIGFLTDSFNTMVASIKDAKHKLEDYSNHLEEKVEERTKELLFSMKEIEKLKVQQDGDYFLTKLIIEPLASNVSGDDIIKIKSLTHQKKKFEFKKKFHEIGGDICISEIIRLRGKKFTAFINGDAMGKSIQGAGGALALGVVFKSILSRNKIVSEEESLFPERWLKQAYQELQSIFESFDGSMMVSVVMGLVDNERGFVYYINAEHPFCVLYRDKKASFIESELSLHKIGMTLQSSLGAFQIKTFKLENDDIILMGSDGKDDIRIGKDDMGGRIINEDESLFLATVEEANAELEEIFKITQQKGELTDDFSLLRIEYKDPSLESAQIESSRLKLALQYYNNAMYKKAKEELQKIEETCTEKTYLRLKANIAYKMGDFLTTANTYSIFMDYYPEESAFLMATAKSYKISNKLELAADYSERLRLREPKNINNLILLIEIYKELKLNGRAKKILDTALLFDRENPKLLELQIELR